MRPRRPHTHHAALLAIALTLAACEPSARGAGSEPGSTATTARPTTAPTSLSPATAPATPTLPPTVIVPPVAEDPTVRQLIAALQQRGLAPQPLSASQLPWLTAPGQAYRLAESITKEQLYLHIYASSMAAQANADQIPPTGNNGVVEWIAPPHFFRCDNVIGVYLGRDQRVLDTLTEQ